MRGRSDAGNGPAADRPAAPRQDRSWRLLRQRQGLTRKRRPSASTCTSPSARRSAATATSPSTRAGPTPRAKGTTLETAEALAALGLLRYEISNFAQPGHESRHNAKYWDDAPFLGFGMSAHSYRDGRRLWNLDSYGAYCRAIEASGSALAGERVLTPRERLGEALFTGLRRSAGVDLAAFRRRYGVDPLAEFAVALQRPFDAGLLEQRADHLRLTERGVLLSNEVFQAFV